MADTLHIFLDDHVVPANHELVYALAEVAQRIGEVSNRSAGDPQAYPRRHGRRVIRFADLILYRERLFPSTPENRWPGDAAWMTRAAKAFVDWLDDLTVDATSTVEAALTIAWQLHLAGEAGAAKNVVEMIGTRAATEEGKPGLHHLARMGVRLGAALPREIAKEALARGVLTMADEIEMLRQLAATHDAATMLAIGRLTDTGDKLALMQFLLPLAETTGDGDHAADLKRRIQIAENARDELGTELVSSLSR